MTAFDCAPSCLNAVVSPGSEKASFPSLSFSKRHPHAHMQKPSLVKNDNTSNKNKNKKYQKFIWNGSPEPRHASHPASLVTIQTSCDASKGSGAARGLRPATRGRRPRTSRWPVTPTPQKIRSLQIRRSRFNTVTQLKCERKEELLRSCYIARPPQPCFPVSLSIESPNKQEF